MPWQHMPMQPHGPPGGPPPGGPQPGGGIFTNQNSLTTANSLISLGTRSISLSFPFPPTAKVPTFHFILFFFSCLIAAPFFARTRKRANFSLCPKSKRGTRKKVCKMGHSQQQQQQRHLKELLQEDQEPFKLSSYIADKRSKLSNHLWKRPHRQKHHHHHHQSLHLQKQPPNKLSTVSRKAPFPSNFCTNSTCFPFSYSSSLSPFGSPDNFRKSSPVLSSPHNKSTINIKGASSASSPHEFSLRVPAKTATLLLEAALRIQNNSSSSNNNSKVQVKNSGLGLLGSVIRRVTLTHHRRAHKHLTRTGESPTRDGVVKWVDDGNCGGRRKSNKSSRREYVSAAEIRGEYHDMGFGGKSNYELEDQTRGSDGKLGRFWSEEINKSEESSGSSSFSTSSSSCYTTSSYSNGDCCSNIIREESDEEVACVSSLARHSNCIIGGDGSAADDFTFCLSPNVRFGHYNNSSCSSPGRCPNSPASPSSPAKSSPSRFNFEERVNFEQQNSSVETLQGKGEGYHDQEDKEHNSPVCVLDLVFGDEEEKDDDDDDEAFSLNSCSYKLVQRARQHLLRKLQNFEELAAELEEPIKKLDYEEEEEEEGDDSSSSAVCINDIDKCNSQEDDVLKPVAGMKRLISDLICEEDNDDYEVVIRRVWKRLETWDEIAPSTIEMMVGLELINGGVQKNWKYDGEEEIAGAAMEVELLILSVLVEEVVNDVLLN